MKLAYAVLSLFILSSIASAWGPVAHDYFCRGAVHSAWGAEGLKCLDESSIDPATYPEFVLNDSVYHYDFAKCPIQHLRDNEWICSRNDSPAKERISYWLSQSENAIDLCSRVTSFCTASSYFADSKFPLYEVSYLDGCLGGPPADDVDAKIQSGESNWTVTKTCSFSYMKNFSGGSRKTSSHVAFIIRQEDVEAVLTELTAKAAEISGKDYAGTTSTTVSTQTTGTTTPPTTVSTIAPATTDNETTPGTTSSNDEDLRAIENDINESVNGIVTMLEGGGNRTVERPAPNNDAMLAFVVIFVSACMTFVGYVVLHTMKVSEHKRMLEQGKPPEKTGV